MGKTAREIIKKEAKDRINEIYPQIEAEKNLNIYTSIPEITSDRSKNQKSRETLFSQTSKSNEKSIQQPETPMEKIEINVGIDDIFKTPAPTNTHFPSTLINNNNSDNVNNDNNENNENQHTQLFQHGVSQSPLNTLTSNIPSINSMHHDLNQMNTQLTNYISSNLTQLSPTNSQHKQRRGSFELEFDHPNLDSEFGFNLNLKKQKSKSKDRKIKQKNKEKDLKIKNEEIEKEMVEQNSLEELERKKKNIYLWGELKDCKSRGFLERENYYEIKQLHETMNKQTFQVENIMEDKNIYNIDSFKNSYLFENEIYHDDQFNKSKYIHKDIANTNPYIQDGSWIDLLQQTLQRQKAKENNTMSMKKESNQNMTMKLNSDMEDNLYENGRMMKMYKFEENYDKLYCNEGEGNSHKLEEKKDKSIGVNNSYSNLLIPKPKPILLNDSKQVVKISLIYILFV